jgi:1-acyl-sn-glycerol-3-phosphate acyltransferase
MRDAYVAGTLGVRRSIIRQRALLFASALGAGVRRSAGWLSRAIFTAWILLVFVVSVPILWGYLAIRRPGPHADRAAKRWSRFALIACGLRPRVVGLEHLQGLEAAVLVTNHASYIDSVVLMAAIPVAFRFVAKRALTHYPLIGTVIRKAQHLTIERAGLSDRLAGADEVERRLREGERLVVFAEGTFARRPGLLPFRLGAFRAAVDSARPIVPIALAGTRRVLPAETWLFERAPITVTVGAPVEPRAGGWPEMVRLRDAAVNHIARESGESTFANQTTQYRG